MSMLYRIIMNVITMPPNILFVSQRVFPVSALPDPTFTFETESASPGGNVQMACKWSGKTTIALIVNG